MNIKDLPSGSVTPVNAGAGALNINNLPSDAVTVVKNEPAKSTGILDFVKNEVTGTPQDTGFFGGLIQSTLGQKGIIGVVQNLAKAVAAKDVSQTQVHLNEAQQMLADATLKAIDVKKNLKDPNRIAYYDKLISDNMNQLHEMGVTNDQLGKLIPTQKENLGTALNAGATIASFGVGGAGKGAVEIAKTAAKVGALGAVQGFGSGLTENKSYIDSAKQALVTGLASAGTFGLLSGAGQLAGETLKKLPVKLYSFVTKLDEAASTRRLDAGEWGTLGKLQQLYQEGSTKYQGIIQNQLVDSGETMSAKQITDKVVSEMQSKWQGYTTDEIKSALEGLKIGDFNIPKAKVDFQTANQIRHEIDTTIGEAWNTANPKFNLDLRQTFANEIRNTIKSKIPGLAEDFQQLSDYTKGNINMTRIIKKQSNKLGVGLGDLITGLGVEGLFGGISGIGAVAAKHIASSPAVQTGGAVALKALNEVIAKIPTDTAGKISREALIQAINQSQKP